MGNICKNLESPLKPKTSCCSKCGKPQGSNVLTSFQSCSHLICSQCLSAEDGNHFVCPLGPDKGNVLVELGKHIYNSVTGFNHQQQLCPRKHKMIWRDEFDQCLICKTHMHGYKCRICNQSICTLCSKVLNAAKKSCPNNHSLVWRSNSIPCLICGVKKHGWTCRECRWFMCSDCSDTTFSSLLCPNDHAFTWKADKFPCNLCKCLDKGFWCETCSFFACPTCLKFSYERSTCPNHHPTEIQQRSLCTKCDSEAAGVSCQICQFHFCKKCDLDNFTSVAKTRIEGHKSVRVMVESPLLQFQRKTSVLGIMQAGAKAAKVEIPEIPINEIKDMHETKSTMNPVDSVESIREQIIQNPQKTFLYLKLAHAYSLVEDFTNEMGVYSEAYEVEKNKQHKDAVLLYNLSEKACNRAIMIRDPSILPLLSRTIELTETYPDIQEIGPHQMKWMLLRAEHLLQAGQTALAREEMDKCEVLERLHPKSQKKLG